MGAFANKLWLKVVSWIIAAVIVVLNVYLIIQTIMLF